MSPLLSATIHALRLHAAKAPAPSDNPPIIGVIVELLEHILSALATAVNSYGIAIIIFTICVRGLLTPLTLRQLRSAKKMTALSPEIKKIQAKYKGNREELSKAQMALYKEHGVNPAAGCLPLLLQMPILYSMFFVFRHFADTPHTAAFAIFHTHFLWFTLDKSDQLFGHFLVPGTFWGPLPILAASTQWIQQRMMMQPTSDPQQRTTQQMLQFMPLLIFFFAVQYAAGLALYWVVSTLFSITVQYFVTGFGQLFTNPLRIPEAASTPALAGVSSSGSRANSATSSGGKNGRANGRLVAASSSSGAGVERNGNGASGKGGASADGPPWKRVSSKSDAVVEPIDELTDDSAAVRLGKMQRAAMRSTSSGKQRPRSAKGAKR